MDALHCWTATVTAYYVSLRDSVTVQTSRYDNYSAMRELVGSVSVVRLICWHRWWSMVSCPRLWVIVCVRPSVPRFSGGDTLALQLSQCLHRHCPWSTLMSTLKQENLANATVSARQPWYKSRRLWTPVTHSYFLYIHLYSPNMVAITTIMLKENTVWNKTRQLYPILTILTDH